MGEARAPASGRFSDRDQAGCAVLLAGIPRDFEDDGPNTFVLAFGALVLPESID